MDVLKADVAILKTDVATLKTDVSELKVDVSEIRTELGQIRVDMHSLENRMTLRLGGLMGASTLLLFAALQFTLT